MSGSVPQPIQTVYKGYKFRSRLEARWAVFLDSLGLKWEYEKEGYNVDGTWYLPDFWLPYECGEPGWGYWIEIKPDPLDSAQVKLLDGLTRLTGHRTYALCGQPHPGEHTVYVFQHHHNGAPEAIPLISEGWLIETGGGETEFGDPVSADVGILTTAGKTFRFPSQVWPPCQAGFLKSAFEAARQARFEHGERPHPADPDVRIGR